MAYRNNTERELHIRDSENKETIIAPGEEIDDVDHPRIQACIANKEFICTDPPKPKKPEPPPPADIEEAVLRVPDLVEKDEAEKDEPKSSKKRQKRGSYKTKTDKEKE